jgi:hypothetical protein
MEDGVMLRALILICSLTSSVDCSEQSATYVIRVPERFTTPTACLSGAQEYIAKSELSQDLKNETMNIICRRDHANLVQQSP